MSLRVTGVVVVSSAVVLIGGLPAVAGVTTTCNYDDVSTAAITSSATSTVTISRSGDAIHVDGVPCETATVANTDTITLDAPTGSFLVVDLSGGAFAPGLTDEGDGSSEIEVSEVGPGDLDRVGVTGGAGADHLVAGETTIMSVTLAAINLNAGEATDDFDVTFSADLATDVQLVGSNGADSLIAGTATIPAVYPVTLDGGGSDDVITYFANGGSIDGGAGTDLLDESTSGAAVTIPAMQNLIVAGLDPADMSGIEDVIGGTANDQLYGDSAANHLQGGAGHDVLVGDVGNDTLDGGTGVDTMFPGAGQDQVIGEIGGFDALDYADAAAGVSVSLLSGTSTGDGDDTLIGDFIAVFGSAFDDTLTGDERTNQLEGEGGDDNLRGDAGSDLVVGGAGNDVVGGGLGNDRLDAGVGSDVLIGKQGDDEYLGGAGIDEAEFLTATHALTIDLRDGTATGQGQDQLSGIERVDGGPKGDRIRGDGANNDLDGFGGSDRLFGRAGNDRLNGGGASDRCNGGPGNGDQAQHCEVVTGIP